MKNCPQTGDSLAAWESSITCLTSTSKTRKGVTGPKHSLDSVPQSCSSHHWTPVFFGSPHCPEPFRWILEFFPAPHLRWVMVFVTRKMFRVLLSPMSSQSRKDWEHSIRYRQTKSADLFIYLFIIISFLSADLDPGYQEQVTQVVLEMRSNPFISRWSQTKKKKAQGNGKFSGIIWPFITSNWHLDSWNAGYIYLRI